jgi:hypothetical protein
MFDAGGLPVNAKDAIVESCHRGGADPNGRSARNLESGTGQTFPAAALACRLDVAAERRARADVMLAGGGFGDRRDSKVEPRCWGMA